jgi:hypothetical protein
MNISLTAELENAVNAKLKSGLYDHGGFLHGSSAG